MVDAISGGDVVKAVGHLMMVAVGVVLPWLGARTVTLVGAALASLAGAGATGVVAFAFLLDLSLSLSGGYAHRPRHSSTHGKVASNKDGKVFSLRTFSQ
jgi:hypothetical protein